MHEKELRKILGANLEPSRVIDARMEEAYRKIRNAEVVPSGKKSIVIGSPMIKNVIVGIGSVAAVFALMVTFCVMNPVLASEIPVLGGVFSKISDLFSFGKLPEEDTVILYQEGTDTLAEQNNAGDTASGAQDVRGAAVFQQTSGDITITLTEMYATNQAVFIGVNVKNAQEFPEMALFADGTQSLSVETVEQYSFRSDAIQSLRGIEGKFADAHTFEGIMRIDYSEINVDESRYQKMLQSAGIAAEDSREADNEGFWLTDENYAQYIDYYEIPETFTVKLDISNIVGDLAQPVPLEGQKSGEELERMTDEEWETYMKGLPQEWYDYPNKYQNWWQEGRWSFDLTITQKDSASRVIEVNQTNEAGIGIRSIELSSVEMTLNTIEGADTVTVALDADGNKIENGSQNMYELAIAGHDISKVYLYICDWDEYMDEIKGYGVPGNNLGRSFQEVLEERALFKTVVETAE
ncbi:MAG: DUF4179 domain-containing protein [Lachnospiraceae bacterium]|nr:DUF4179 domain-containing protein [Lachnospiraceae bacterium]